MRNKILSAITGAVLVLSLTSACQATPPDISLDQAKAFQSRVLAVTTTVADGGYAAALEALTALETELDAAAAEGSVSFARHQRIEAALVALRADIEAAIAAQAKPEPEPEPEPEPAPVDPTPVEEEEVVTPDTETDAEKKAREDAAKAAEEAKKAAEEAQKKADEEAKKAAEEAAKKAEEEAKNKAEEAKDNGDSANNNSGNGDDDD